MADALLKAFGASVRKRRAALGLSQEAFADRCGVHRTYIGGVERGERNISLQNIVAVAKALGVHPGTLLSDLPSGVSHSRRSR